MKKILPACLRGLFCSGLLLLMNFSASASHIVGAELRYQWQSCNTYTITVYLYGDCGPSSAMSFSSLPISTPVVCIYDGDESSFPVASVTLPLVPAGGCGLEVTPVCPDSLAYTQCSVPTSTLPGIKKFTYSQTYTFPHASAHWRLAYTSDNGGTPAAIICPGLYYTGSTTTPAAAGRAAAITNILSGTSIQLIDTLNNSVNNTRGHNSSPVLTVEPVPYFCAFYEDCYNPGAVDVNDVGPGEPSGDSLHFALVAATNGGGTCPPTLTVTSASYTGNQWPGGPTVNGSHPLTDVDGTSASFSFDSSTGQLCFNPETQRSVVVYNLEEFRNDTVGTINTIADVTGTAGFTGDLGAATVADIHNPSGICSDTLGNIYFADNANNRIRKISTLGIISTIAGTGAAGYGGDGLSALGAQLNSPTGIAINSATGDLYVADYNNNAIRRITPGGIITTAVNIGAVAGFTGDGGPAVSANLSHPTAVFVDNSGNIYISDNGNERVREVNSATNIINTIGGNGTAGFIDGALGTNEINNPWGMFVDASGNVYLADAGNSRIRKITPGGAAISTVVGNGTAGDAGDNCMASTAELHFPTDVALDAEGNMFIADSSANVIREVYASTGMIQTYAGTGVHAYSGDGGYPYAAELFGPQFFCLDPSGNMFISDFYNNRIRKITVNTAVNKVLVGSLQREMTFYVKSCDYTIPTGKIDSVTGPTGTETDSTHLYACQYSGSFNVNVTPKEEDTSLEITVTSAGLTTGFSFSVDSNGTNHPHATVTGNTSVITPGNYTFYLTYTDNHCPLVGTNTVAFSVTILPVPNISDVIVTPALCSTPATVKITPGGTGKPWTIKLSGAAPPPTLVWNPADTFAVFTLDSLPITTMVPPPPQESGDTARMTIFTAISNNCAVTELLYVAVPTFSVTGTFTNPDYCGAPDGSIVLHGLTPGHLDTLRFIAGTVSGGFFPQPPIGFVVSPAGTDTVTHLRGSLIYDSIKVQEDLCFTDNAGPITLVDPPMIFRTVTTTNPTKCGYSNGIDTLWGLHPGQFDTLTYTKTEIIGGVPVSTTPVSAHFIASDSFIVLTGLTGGTFVGASVTYANFVVNTAGVCRDSIFGPFTLSTPAIDPGFDTLTDYGCKADTMFFTNTSTPAADLTYRWLFTDGESSTDINPSHVFYTISDDSVGATLVITNGVCVDSITKTKLLNNFVHANFSFTPDPYVCQDSLVTITNLSTGTNPAFTWYFGDGTTDNVDVNPTHVFNNTGQKTITLVASDFVPCYDTMTKTIEIDSISAVSLLLTDSVICSGQQITFSGIYSNLGNTTIAWSFGDGSNVVNVEPIAHSYDGAGVYTVSVTIQYRSCPTASASRQVLVYGYPSIYLGPDTSICPGGNPITLYDNRNAGNPKATWLWSTGETTPGITVTQPGTYSTVVTIDGCYALDTVVVQKDCYMDIPNVFTPNNDGVNDYFFPRQFLSRGVITFKMAIYNRWGQMIYETTNTDGSGWDGMFNGEPQPVGVYVYVIDGTFKDGQIEHHQGNITLLR